MARRGSRVERERDNSRRLLARIRQNSARKMRSGRVKSRRADRRTSRSVYRGTKSTRRRSSHGVDSVMRNESQKASRKLRRGTPHPQSKYRAVTSERKQKLLRLRALLRQSLTSGKEKKVTKKSAKAKREECKAFKMVYDRKTKKCRESRRRKKRQVSRSAEQKHKRDACKARLGDHYTYDAKLERRSSATKGCRRKCGGNTKVNDSHTGCVSRST